eukprot:5355323-Pyramimonas_sp.AAC.1
MHWGKLQLLRIRCRGKIRAPQGEDIAPTDTLSHLGTTLDNDGKAGGELTGRLGMAFAGFRKLKQLWGHSNIGEARKLELFNAAIISKLLCSLCSVALNAAEKRRLDGARCRMLRTLCGVRHPMISR